MAIFNSYVKLPEGNSNFTMVYRWYKSWYIELVYGVYKPINITVFFWGGITLWKCQASWSNGSFGGLNGRSTIERFQHVARGFLLISVFSSPRLKKNGQCLKRNAGPQVRRSRLHLQMSTVCPGCKSKSSNPASVDCGVKPSPRIFWDCQSGCWVPVIGLWKGYQVAIRFQWCFSPIISSSPTCLFPNHPKSSKKIWNKLGSSNDFPSFPGELHCTIRKSFRIGWFAPWIISRGPRSCDSSRCPWLETSREIGISMGNLSKETVGASPWTTQKLVFVSHDLSTI